MDTAKKLADALREIGEWDHRGDSVAEAYDEKHGFGAFMTLIEDATLLSTPAAADAPEPEPVALTTLCALLGTSVAKDVLGRLSDGQGTDTDDGRTWLRASALAASQPAPVEVLVPDGWKLVPIEPTREMCVAYHVAQDEWDEGGLNAPDHQWAAMLAAAPTPSKGEAT